MTVLAADTYSSNAELIEACVALGYLRDDWTTLDATFGRGTFWKAWRPKTLHTNDLRTPADYGFSFTEMPFADEAFDAVVLDPPYKLNGTPTPSVDERYGVHESARWQDRHELILDGIEECARIAHEVLLVKCQDQVCSGQVRWQTRIFADAMESHGLRVVDSLLMLGGRAQPEGRRQVHARRNYSTLLVGARNLK